MEFGEREGEEKKMLTRGKFGVLLAKKYLHETGLYRP
jgi:hypothetical protein